MREFTGIRCDAGVCVPRHILVGLRGQPQACVRLLRQGLSLLLAVVGSTWPESFWGLASLCPPWPLTPEACSSVCLYRGSGGSTQILMITQQVPQPLGHPPSPFIDSFSESCARNNLGLCLFVFPSSLDHYHATKRLMYKSCLCLWDLQS